MSRLRDVWPFTKPKTPGYGISREFYLSVLTGVAQMPAIAQLVDPKATGGAVAGFGAPLAGEVEKTKLVQPMERGAYALAAPDRKTVLKMFVLPREEAGFDPEALLRSTVSQSLGDETRNRIAATWMLCQLSFEAHDPMVYASLDFLLAVCERLGELTQGVIADPLSETYKLPAALRAADSASPVDSRNFVNVKMDRESIYTRGMQKFALPEFEINGITGADEALGAEFLYGLCQMVLLRGPVEPGARVGAKATPLQIAEGGLDRAKWEGIPCFELIPVQGGTTEALRAWGSDRRNLHN